MSGRRAQAGNGGNVVTLPQRLIGADAIVAEVAARSKRESDAILQQFDKLQAILDARHLDRANQLLPLALKMDAPTLIDFIEIGRELLSRRNRA